MLRTLLAEVNISEGRDKGLIGQVREELLKGGKVKLLDENSDSDHNRTVFTYVGEPEAVLEATRDLAGKAIALIDMTAHKGSHPRMGAVDVVPFVPVRNVTTEEAVAISRSFGRYLGSLGVPVFYYEDAALQPGRKSLVDIRRGEYEGLEAKLKDPAWTPDEGPSQFNAKSGGTVTGSRFPLVAFNVNLATEDMEAAKAIVKAVRGATGGFQCIRAMALEIPARKQVQISMNLVDYRKSPIHRVFETIKSEAGAKGIAIAGTELVGPMPLDALKQVLEFYLRVQGFSMEQVY
jgi:glutamate formiminotransferase / 5-formyltetrahydrofolate cyclo-ligase